MHRRGAGSAVPRQRLPILGLCPPGFEGFVANLAKSTTFWPLPALALALALGLALGGTNLVYRYESDRVNTLGMRRLADLSTQLAARIDRITVVLQVSRSFMESRQGNAISRARFSRFEQHLRDAGMLDGIQGLGFSTVLLPADVPLAEARILEDYGVSRQIWPAAVPGQLRTAITLLEPADQRNVAALGYDMFADETRRAAMSASMLSGRVRLTAPVSLVQEITDERQAGVLLYLYMKSDLNNELPGFLYAPLRLGEMLDTVLASRHSGYDLRLRDTEAENGLLYASGAYLAAPALAEGFSKRMDLAGRQWELSLRDGRASPVWQRLPMTFISGALALVSALLFAATTAGLQRAFRSARELGVAQARNLAQKDLHLREMSHRLKNVLARVMAIARQSAARAPDKQALMLSLNSRLQAMAAAQDLLTRGSAAGGISLRELLRAELAQLYGDTPDSLHMDGPDLRLTPEQTEALGLSIHELATNALKYGAGRVPGDFIVIHWTLEEGHVVLSWEEHTQAAPASPAAPGFGTRLMDSCIQLTLGGQIQRDFRPEGLRIRITFPLTPRL